jgi:hypothetical protein
MATETIIQFLKIFGLIVFDIFFLVMIIFSIYLFFIVGHFKKVINSVHDEVKRTVANFEDDSYSVASALKSKIENIDSKKIIWGSTLLGGLFVTFSNVFLRQNKRRGLARSLFDMFF